MLQEDWWMRVLRPNSVSTGCTDRQLDWMPQSPQPSHTRSLITMRVFGSATRPRLRSRRFSAAHCWSWMSTVTPSVWRRVSCASMIFSRSHTSTPGARSMPLYLPLSSVVMIVRRTPSLRSQ